MIIAAAIQFTKDEKVFVVMGKRHGDCFETAYNCGLRRPWQEIQGFVTDKFEFLDRFEAWKEADREFQIIPYPENDTPSPGMLFSEDLW